MPEQIELSQSVVERLTIEVWRSSDSSARVAAVVGDGARGGAVGGAGAGAARRAARFTFALVPRDWEELRWYFEDYPRYPPLASRSGERRLDARSTQLGVLLFQAVFESSDPLRAVWRQTAPRLARTRIEVVCSAPEFDALPWELMMDPSSGQVLATAAESLVRVPPGAPDTPIPEPIESGLRMLLVISRPLREADVPLRSVAMNVVRGGASKGRSIRVVRPATERALVHELEAAARSGAPYDVVHFDGHGMFGTAPHDDSPRGYIVFEGDPDPAATSYMDGGRLGDVLAENGVRVLVLNACRSGYQPERQVAAAGAAEPNARLGSLAMRVASAGVQGVVAMRYDVYVETAARFVRQLYDAIDRGDSLATSVTAARRDLARVAAEDATAPVGKAWAIPAVYEAAGAQVVLATRPDAERDRPAPAADETLTVPRHDVFFALDRGMLHGGVALLQGWAGIGKTTTSAEFTQWYRATQTMTGPVVHMVTGADWTAATVMGHVADELSANGFDAPSEAREDPVALGRFLGDAGALLAWEMRPEALARQSPPTEHDREVVRTLLEAGAAAGARTIVESRSRVSWLHSPQLSFDLQPLSLADDSYDILTPVLARAGIRFEPFELFPVVQFSLGNPRTVSRLAEDLVDRQVQTHEELRNYARHLDAGATRVPGDPWQPDPERLTGVDVLVQNFSGPERDVIALLSLFRGMLWGPALAALGEGEAGIPEVHEVGREGITALLVHGSELGLLSQDQAPFFFIHPSAAYDLSEIFETSYGSSAHATSRHGDVERTWAEYFGNFGRDVAARATDHKVHNAVLWNERNLVRAWGLAIANGWPRVLSGTLRGLHTVFWHTGRRPQWESIIRMSAQACADAGGGLEVDWTDVREDLRQLASEVAGYGSRVTS
jgi:hypothetical protein